MQRFLLTGFLSTIAVLGLASAPAHALSCGTGDFAGWVKQAKKEAKALGISNRAVRALNNVQYNERVIRFDRRQRVFTQTFLKFSGRMVNKNRMDHGRIRMKKFNRTLKQIEAEYGVPGPVIAAFWGLETDYGANTGDFDTLSALATLSYDCRRPEKFQPELFAALKVIDRGDLVPSEMQGAWAGELGQTQFLPTHYVTFAVDYDGDGRRNLIKSGQDVLASTANYLKNHGWQSGKPWLEEVKVPRRMPWQEAGLDIKHPRSQWAKWGIKTSKGSKLPKDNVSASLLLPMGKNGPAFLAYENFNVFLEWNESLVYSTTAAYFATRLSGAKAISKGRGDPTPLSYNQTIELQNALKRRGYDVGKVDGIIGARTRASVKDMQLKLGLPADSWPTPNLLAKLR